jgi:hypothetical protein
MTLTTYPVIDVTVAVGTVLRFEKADVISATVTQEINPVSVELPISTLEFKVLNTYSQFTMFAGETYELLSQRLPVMVYESVGGGNHFIGKFYLQSWKNVSDTEIEFTAIDIIGVLADTDFDGMFFSTATTLPDIMAAIFVPADVAYTIDATLETVELTGWIPPTNYREALQQICFAAGAMAITAESSTLDLAPVVIPDTTYTDEILDTEKSMNQSVELLPLVTKIELVSHTYTQGADIEDIYEAELEIGTYKIVFENPYHTIIITGPGYVVTTLSLESGDDFVLEDGSTLLEVGGEYTKGPNSLYLEVSEAGTVKITGYQWLDSKRSHIFNETVSVEFQNRNTKLISDATMISLVNAQTILDQLRDYYRLRYKQSMRLLDSTNDVGEIVLTSTIQSKEIIGTVIKRDLSLTGGNLSDVVMLGIEYEEA